MAQLQACRTEDERSTRQCWLEVAIYRIEIPSCHEELALIIPTIRQPALIARM